MNTFPETSGYHAIYGGGPAADGTLPCGCEYADGPILGWEFRSDVYWPVLLNGGDARGYDDFVEIYHPDKPGDRKRALQRFHLQPAHHDPGCRVLSITVEERMKMVGMRTQEAN